MKNKHSQQPSLSPTKHATGKNYLSIVFSKNLLATSISALLLVACGGDYTAQSCQTGQVGCGNTTSADNTDSTNNGNTNNENNNNSSDGFDWSALERNTSAIGALTQANSTAWNASSGDETALDLTISGNTAVVATYWHNKAHSFKLSDNVATLQADFDFATVAGARHTVDATSGASEQPLTGMTLSDDASVLMGSVTKAGENTTGNTGIGLYASRADSSGTFKTVAFASSETNSFYSLANITANAINNTNQQIAVATKSGEVQLLNSNLSQAIATVNLSFEVNALAFTSDGKGLFVAGKKKTGVFSSIGVVALLKVGNSSLSESWRWTTADSISQLIAFSSDAGKTRVLAKPSSGSNLYIIGSDNDTTPKHKVIEIAGSPTDIAISPDNSLIAVSQLRQAEVINLDNNKRAAVNTTENIGGIGFSKNTSTARTYLWIASQPNLMSYTVPNGVSN